MRTKIRFALSFLICTLVIFSCVTTTDSGNQDNDDILFDDNTPEFNVTKELYTQTFGEIEDLIKRLNKIIDSGNFAEWKKYLSSIYIKKFSDSSTLSEYSELPILKDKEIVLKDLNDYFKWVVVPSRSNVRLDELKFVSEDKVIAYMVIENKKTILYQLEKIDEKWKISIW